PRTVINPAATRTVLTLFARSVARNQKATTKIASASTGASTGGRDQSLGPATARLVSSRSSVTAPTSRPALSTTAISGLRLLPITVATSSRVAAGATVVGLGTGLGRQSPTVSLPGPCQNRSAWISSTVRTSAGSSRYDSGMARRNT